MSIISVKNIALSQVQYQSVTRYSAFSFISSDDLWHSSAAMNMSKYRMHYVMRAV